MLRSPSFDTLDLPGGTELFREGDAADHAYLIMSGAIEVYLLREGREVLLATLGPGEIIGEMAIVDSGPRTAHARVQGGCSLAVISREQFATRLTETDPVLRMCLEVVLRRYRSTIKRMRHVEPERAATPAGEGAVRHAPALDDLATERAMLLAIERDELDLFYQPILELADRHLAGFEALMRWHHPQEGLIPPGRFIPVAEAGGSILQLTSFGLRRMARDLPRLVDADPSRFVSINVSSRDLVAADFVPQVEACLRDAGVGAAQLKIEVTESGLMRDPDVAVAGLARVRAAGVGIALDDFGTGHSSLAYLCRLPVTTLKIDRGFVAAMDNDPASLKVVQMIVRLGAELDLPVVAEGIENEAQAARLQAMGCRYGQGYLFARPLPLARALQFAEAHRSGQPLAKKRA